MLEVRDLETAYGRSQVLFRVSFDIRQGEVVTLLGRNGAGKTTTLKSVMGMVGRREGAIAFEGRPIGALPSHKVARLGIAMRASSMNRRAARLMGVNVGRVSMTAWGLATGIGLVAGMLIAPLTFLDFEMMVIVLLKAFAGAILGGFNSLPGAVIGCLVVGVLENLFGAYVSTAFKDAFAFSIIVAVLMLRPAGLFTRKAGTKV